MRIVTIVSDLGMRGTQRAACAFTSAYQHLGHEVAVLTLSAGGPRQASLDRQNIPVWIGGETLDQAIRHAQDFQPDIIHFHRGGAPIAYPEELRALTAIKRPSNRVLETNVFGRVTPQAFDGLIDVHLQISRWCLYRWRRWLGANADNVPGVLVPNPVDVGAFERCPDEQIADYRKNDLNIPPDAFVCGRLGKTHPLIFQSFEKLAQRDPHAYLISVNDSETAEAGIASLSQETRRRVRVAPLLTSDAALSRFYSAMDCFLHSTFTGESFGYVLVEAMLCGTPVVTSSQPHKDNAQMEVVGHMKGGIIAGSMQRLPEALIEIWRDAAAREQMRSQCRRLITSRYEMHDVAKTAIRVGELALGANNRRDISASLKQANDLVTDISRKEIDDLLRNTLGGPRLSEIVLMKLVHQPMIQALYQKRRSRGFDVVVRTS